MAEMIQKLHYYMGYSFVVYAVIVGILIALCSSLLGVTLVLKRYSYIGDGLSHVAFGAMSIATVLDITNTLVLVMPVTILIAVFLLKASRHRMIKGDALIAMLSVGSLALGYMLMNVFSSAANISGDVCSTLFGSTSILTISKTEVFICIVMSIVVILIYILFYHRIFAITFDENFAEATGVKTDRYNLLIAIVIAVIIVLGMTLVGSLLISALVIFPALSAMRIIENFKGVVICSAVFSVLCAFFGMMVSMLYSTPVGSTIVIANILVFIVCSLIRKVLK
ncbi:MAG: metal ABC transporter permease [Johnsonella sp.]|nr:metal ABC transporter permease [Johnsonella sp.]